MRKSSGFKEKLFTNDSALCIVGNRIRLEGKRGPNRRYTNSRTVRSSPETPVVTGDAKKPEPEKRQTVKLNVKELRDLQVRSRQLQRVQEIAEVEDFERILGKLCVGDDRGKNAARNRANDIIAQVNPREVYEHFFGQHYDYLRSLVDD